MNSTDTAHAIAKKFELADQLAERLEKEEVDYDWADQSMCVIGQLASLAMNLNPGKLDEIIAIEQGENLRVGGCWGWCEIERCPDTGIPFSQIFRTLESVGISTEAEIDELEHVSNSIVCERLGFLPDKWDVREVAAYLHAYAQLGHEGVIA